MSFIKVKKVCCPACGKEMKCVALSYTEQDAFNKIASESEIVYVCDCSKPGESEHVVRTTIKQRGTVEVEE